MGLMRAAELFDPNKGSFATYAVLWVRASAQRALQRHASLVRLPVAQHAAIQRCVAHSPLPCAYGLAPPSPPPLLKKRKAPFKPRIAPKRGAHQRAL